jgi:hypothetical protein
MQEARPNGTQRSFLEGDPSVTGGAVTYAFHMPAGAWFLPLTHPTTARENGEISDDDVRKWRE